MKGVYFLVPEPWPEGQASGLAHLEATEVLSGNRGRETLSLCPPLPQLQLTNTSHKGDCTLVWSPSCDLQIVWFFGPVGLTPVVPQDYIYLYPLKGVA